MRVGILFTIGRSLVNLPSINQVSIMIGIVIAGEGPTKKRVQQRVK